MHLVRSRLTPNGKKAKKLLLEATKESLTADVDKLLAAKRIGDLNITTHEFREWAQRLLQEVDRTNTDRNG